MERASVFNKKREEYRIQLEELNRKYNTLSTIRIVLFITSMVTVIYFLNGRAPIEAMVAAVLFAILFGTLVNYHNKIKKERRRRSFLMTINEEELLRLSGKLRGFDDGLIYATDQHAYSKDMDVLGSNSLYQLINRANTPTGKELVAQWLNHKADSKEIMARQEAVKELELQVDWSQNFQAAGRLEGGNQKDFDALVKWIDSPNVVLNQRIVHGIAYLLPFIIVTAVVLKFIIGFSFYIVLGLGLVSGYVLKKYAIHMQEVTTRTHQGLLTLASYAELITIIEHSSFTSDYLKQGQQVFRHNGHAASQAIRLLQRLLEFLNARSNWFYAVFNFVFLMDIHLLIRIEKWKKRHQHDVSAWFLQIGKYEAINSLAGFAYANPEFIMPTLSEERYELKANGLGHPLIPSGDRVHNDFLMQGKGSIALITGSNMSGKSTFLRTIGVNMILAYSGAPVCAQEMSLSLMQLFTSMRTEDNLEEHISSFYAELKRIKALLEYTESGEPVLFMLDEILKGTNSQDRHKGAEALIRQLSEKEAMGFVSTHDLELGKMANETSKIENYSFNSEIVEDKIIFNYKLSYGLCKSFNASKLMEQIGIKIN